MSKYKLFIRQYDIMTNDFKVREEVVDTDDIYHTIGKIYSTAFTEIKRIDYQKIDKEKELQERIDKAIEYIEKNTKNNTFYEWYDGEINTLLEILQGSDKE